jgi:PAS domain-containing protein
VTQSSEGGMGLASSNGMQLLTSHEVIVDPHDLIVSKTDLAGRIIYVNAAFERISGYSRSQALGKPRPAGAQPPGAARDPGARVALDRRR